MARRHTRLTLPPLTAPPKANSSPSDIGDISATFQRLRRLGGRLRGEGRARAPQTDAGSKPMLPSFNQAQDEMLQEAHLPVLRRKIWENECQNELQRELKRNKECTPLSTIIVRWSPIKEMPDTLYRWFILQELCKYGPINSVIFSGEKCSQVVFSNILSACKAINSHSIRLPKVPFYCLWYYSFMMKDYNF